VSLQSRAEHVYTCFCMYQALDMYLHVLVHIIMYELVSRAEHECACLSASGDSVMIPYVLTCIKSWACICVCFHESLAYASAGFCTSQELSMY
jgi:hypothetical protein